MFNYDAIASRLQWVHQEMYRRYDLIQGGHNPPLTNFVVDEWRLINKHVPQAKELMKDIISVAREAGLRMIAIAQGMQVSTWGLEGESDLEECFTDILIGNFALEKANSLRQKHSKNSLEYAYWTKVLAFFEQQQRPCLVANIPAIIPDLSNWSREATEESLTPAQSLGEPLRTIWCFAKEQGDWVGTRDLLRKGYSSLKDVNTETAKKYFLALSKKGYGEIDESGNSVKFKVF